MSEDWVDVAPASEGDSSGDWKDVPASTMTDRNPNEAPPQEIKGPERSGSLLSPLNAAAEFTRPESQALDFFNAKAAAGAREYIRSIGTGEDAADSYMRGFIHPEKSQTLQEGAIQGANDIMTKMGVDKLPYAANVTARFLGGLVPSASGFITDIPTNPKTLLELAAFEKFPSLLKQVNPSLAEKISTFAKREDIGKYIKEGTGKVAENIKTGAKDFWNKSPEPKMVEPNSYDIADMIKQVTPDAQEAARTLQQNKTVEMADLRAKHAAIQNGLDVKLKTLDGDIAPSNPSEVTIPKVADEATQVSRNKFWDYAKDLSNRFGQAYQKAISGQKISTQQLYDSLGRAIERDGFLKRPQEDWSDSQRNIYDYQQRIKALLPKTTITPEPTGMLNQDVVTQSGKIHLNMSDVDKELQEIMEVKKYKPYSQGDHILTLTREETANAIGQASQKVAEVRKKFAPELQAKNELTSIVQPFNKSGNFDTTRGINFFSNYAKGSMTDPDQLRLLEVIQSNPKLGGDILKPLDEMNLKRNTILRNKLDLQIRKPQEYQAVNEKYAKLGDTLRKDVSMQRELLQGMRERAVAKEDMAAKIKAAIIGGVGTVTGGGYLLKHFK